MSTLKRTPLFDLYKQLGAKTIDFGGWELPVQFSSIKEEHEAVRIKAGLFDVSHMGELEVKGADSFSFLQKMLTNDLSKLTIGSAQYSVMCYENGGTIDDLLVYQLYTDHYLLIVNAANIEKDYQWLKDHIEGEVELNNLSDSLALLALQGPLSEKILQKVISDDTNLKEIRSFKFKNGCVIQGKKVLISRTGYTGEDGFEIYCQANDASFLWNLLLEQGKEDGLIPCGLGARDTLRFEACLPLYGQELSSEITPLEAGIGFAVKLNKESDFIGKSALKKQKEDGLTRKLVGIEMIDRGIPRHGYLVYANGEKIGFITTGTQSPTLKKNIGLALLDRNYTKLETEVEVEVRKKRLKAKVVSTPFYKGKKK